MRITNLLPFLAAAMLFGQDFGPDIEVPGQQMMSGEGTLPSGDFVRYKTMVSSTGRTPVKPWRGVAGGLTVKNDKVTRVGQDPHDGVWFGYDIAVAGNSANGFILTFGPASTSFINDVRTGGRQPVIPLAKYPSPQRVSDGDTVAIDLMVSADGTQKLTDYVQIISPGRDPQPPPARTTAAPRDITLDDGPVIYNIRRFVILRQGQPVESKGFTGRPGATFWIAFPGEGRYVLSLAPHDGFIKKGAVRDNVISFEAGGQPCEIRFLTPVAGDGQAWNLYVMHDPGYQPKEPLRNAAVTGTARLDELLP